MSDLLEADFVKDLSNVTRNVLGIAPRNIDYKMTYFERNVTSPDFFDVLPSFEIHVYNLKVIRQ